MVEFDPENKPHEFGLTVDERALAHEGFVSLFVHRTGITMAEMKDYYVFDGRYREAPKVPPTGTLLWLPFETATTIRSMIALSTKDRVRMYGSTNFAAARLCKKIGTEACAQLDALNN